MGIGESSSNKVYSVPVPNTKQPGFSSIYRNPKAMDRLIETPDPQFNSIKDIIYTCFQKQANNDFLGRITLNPNKKENGVQERQLTKFSYGTILGMAEKLGTFLIQNKLDFTQSINGMRLVGIYSKNRYEWIVADIACMLYGLTIVPLYDTLGVENLTYCLEHSGVTTLFATSDTVKTILGLKGHGNLQSIILLDPLPQETLSELQKHRFQTIPFEVAVGQNVQILDHRQLKVSRDTILTFSYTSGTTGPPKGALLSHGNFLAFLGSLSVHQIGLFKSDDSYVSFLPLPHLMQRAIMMAIILGSSFVAFYNGDITKFKDDLAFIKPTIFIAVPRLFNRIVEGVQKQFSEATGIKGCLVRNGVNSKMDTLHSNGQYKSGFYDSIVFSKVREKFGGRVRLMITGSAPIKKQTYEMMKVIMCCPFYQGYGQTENTAAAFITDSIDNVSAHVGGIVASLEFKLNDIQEMQYTSEDRDEKGRPTPRGEVWLRGPSVFPGYYKDIEKTKEALTPDGWLRTGDVGVILAGSNALKLIDRRKNIFKLQQGEYVAAEKVEAVYTQSHLINQVFLHGESTQNFCVAILVCNPDELNKLAQKNNISGSYQDICRNRGLRQIIVKEMDALGKKNGLNSFEQAKNITIQPDSFQARGILSSTMKLQRFAAKKYYQNDIQTMYKEGPLITR